MISWVRLRIPGGILSVLCSLAAFIFPPKVLAHLVLLLWPCVGSPQPSCLSALGCAAVVALLHHVQPLQFCDTVTSRGLGSCSIPWVHEEEIGFPIVSHPIPTAWMSRQCCRFPGPPGRRKGCLHMLLGWFGGTVKGCLGQVGYPARHLWAGVEENVFCWGFWLHKYWAAALLHQRASRTAQQTAAFCSLLPMTCPILSEKLKLRSSLLSIACLC